jgi:predicted nucleic acid-binding protein
VILVDTSIWVDHLRASDVVLDAMLADQVVLMHPFVLGELALGGLVHREDSLDSLGTLPRAPVAEVDEVLGMINRLGLAGTGIGYVDAHLLAGTMLARNRFNAAAGLWTRDRKLEAVARRAGVAVHQPLH